MTETAPDYAFAVAALSDRGTERPDNEDCAAVYVESPTSGLLAVADGVSGHQGGGTASKTAIEVLLRAFQEQPPRLGGAKRVHRAAQQANIEVHDLALVVPELSGMATTLTAVVVERGELHAAHVGDSRLYRLRAGKLLRLSKDHIVGRDATVLARSLGRELIAQIDRISAPLCTGDILLVCSDGLYKTLRDAEMAEIIGPLDPESACRALIDAANQRRTSDNVSAAVARMIGAIPGRGQEKPPSILRRLFT
jgi:PPM family protein phosphatase